AGLFDHPFLRTEYNIIILQKLRIGQIFDNDISFDFIIFWNLQYVLNHPPASIPTRFRYLIYPQPKTSSLFRKQEQVIMCIRYQNMLHKISIPRPGSFRPFSTSTLDSVFIRFGSLDVSEMRDRNDHFLIRDQIFYTDLSVCKSDF